MGKTNKKLRRLIIDEEKTRARLAEVQKHLDVVVEARRQEEEREMVRTLRGMKLENWDMFNLLNSIQDGTLTPEMEKLLEKLSKERGVDSAGGEESGKSSQAEDSGKGDSDPSGPANRQPADEETDHGEDPGEETEEEGP